jgi:hypothetical protein
VHEGGVSRSTTLFVANAGEGLADVTLEFYGRDGDPVEDARQTFLLAANGSRYLGLNEAKKLPNGTYSVCAAGDQPLALEELTRADAPSAPSASSATHGMTKVSSSDTFAATHLTRSSASHTAFSVQNTGSATATVDLEYYDLSGMLVYTDSVRLAPKGWERFDQASERKLAGGYAGSLVLRSDQPIVSLVDQYGLPSIYLPFVLR